MKRCYKLFRPINDISKLYVNKRLKKEIILYFVLIISVLMLTTTSSYAYLSTEVNKVTLEEVSSSNIEGVELSNTNINVSNLSPSTESEVLSSLPKCTSNSKEICSMYEFTVNNKNGEVAKNITYYLKNINNTFNNLRFKVYEGEKTTLNSSKTSLYNSDKLTPNIKEIELTGLNNYIKANSEQIYTIVFFIKKIENQELYDALKEFNASLQIDIKTTGYVAE